MRFGPVPVHESVGAILAHTTRLDRMRLSKGTLLTEAHVSALEQAGHTEIVVARLDEEDVHEDQAAAAIGAAIHNASVEAREAATGRANVYARRPGLLRVDPVGIHDVNLVHESITLATLPPWSLVDAGDLVATVKVIPFASPQHVVDACVARARDLVGVHPLRRCNAGLVITELPGSAEKLVRKTIEVQRARLERHGSRLGPVVRCAHEPAALTQALEDLLARGCDPVLLMGASATVDRNDVLPSALRAVGGVVDHLGMPMDPGNQLFIGRAGDVSVIGLPGCARSPAPGGFDVVLRRVLAGLPPSRHDIMRLGVGGLMKQRSVRGSQRRFAAVVLAAGQSRRMGPNNKLLADIDGAPMVSRVVDALLASRVVQVVVVTGHESDSVRAALSQHPVRFVHNPDYADGMSTSLRAGIAAVADDEGLDGAIVALGDMPFVSPSHIDALVTAYDPAEGGTICVPVRGNKRGNPVLWGRRHFDEMRGLTGDLGARDVIRSHPGAVVRVEVGSDAVFQDLDTPEALARALEERLKNE